ncbi:MAG: hypothetical protein U0414_43660 [Polyangiaceae bacterium]
MIKWRRSRIGACGLAFLLGVAGCDDGSTSSSSSSDATSSGSGSASSSGSGGATSAASTTSSTDTTGAGGAPAEFLAVFESGSSDLVAGDTNGATDVFVYSTKDGRALVSHIPGSPSTVATGVSSSPSLSRNGRYLVFRSYAPELQSAIVDDNGASDIFRLDRETGVVTLVTIDASGVAPGNGDSDSPSVSDDGRYVAFISRATNLQSDIPDTNDATDVFVRDMSTGKTMLVSVNASGTAAANLGATAYGRELTPDGRYVVFGTRSSDVASVPDTNGTDDVFVRDLQTKTTTLVSADANGAATSDGSSVMGGQSISDDGRFVVFSSQGTNLQTALADDDGTWDVYLRDLVSGVSTVVSVDQAGTAVAGSSAELFCSISSDGHFVVFASPATTLQSAISDSNEMDDVFRRDLAAKKTILVSVNATGDAAAHGQAYDPFISADGSRVGFQSDATDLVPSYVSNNGGDLSSYLVDLSGGPTLLLSGTSASASGNGSAYLSGLSGP